MEKIEDKLESQDKMATALKESVDQLSDKLAGTKAELQDNIKVLTDGIIWL